MGKRQTDSERDSSVIDASLNCLVGDGKHTKDVLFRIKCGTLRGGAAREALLKARYEDWKEAQNRETP